MGGWRIFEGWQALMFLEYVNSFKLWLQSLNLLRIHSNSASLLKDKYHMISPFSGT